MTTRFSDHETQVLYALIEDITGTHQSGLDRKDFLARNVIDLMASEGLQDFSIFLEELNSKEGLYQKFVSAITIHTTSWFREPEHFMTLKSWLNSRISKGLLSADITSVACSSGQEVYSLGLVLESLRREFPKFEYRIRGIDIDALSLATARSAVYPGAQLKEIPQAYHELCLTKDNAGEVWMTVDPEILKRCSFFEANLLDWSVEDTSISMDVIFCRNVLIYFHPRRVTQVIGSLSRRLRPEGLLVLGQRESSIQRIPHLRCIAPSIYKLTETRLSEKSCALVIEDVAPVRTLIRSALVKSGFEVLEAATAEEASRILLEKTVNLVTLDLDLPGENGASWLKRFRQGAALTPVVIISGSTPEEARDMYGLMEYGASDHFVKETLSQNLERLGQLALGLTGKEFQLDPSSMERFPACLGSTDALRQLGRPEVILIGASTGGPMAIWELLKPFKKMPPPIVIVQHTSASFLKSFAEKTSEKTGLLLGKPTEALRDGHIYLSQGDYHIEIRRNESGHLEIRPISDEPQNGHRPSVDQLFKSAASAKVRAAAIVLTGMGSDGAAGMKALLENTVTVNFVQSRESCAVFGMPKEVIRLGAAHEVGDLSVLRKRLEGLIND